MGKKVEKAIAKIMARGETKSSAIAILKSAGAIHQNHKHLAAGPKRKK